ncbi:S-methyl-5'-thioadenosine phosphorylase [Parerythrobacter jejuensis]|uniref:Purine nucleoside phosphorylase n=1 Tax=Parerythrobacter jejuensis TaxID=795812 RepID=A0A845APP0_9SPHN|nr:S-methyl-5'-thioadenosine phosphorylase [Parerythrobacter jejuensis]MXP31584.1 S-methyl-5'-thioadenosine phosphorylase [Parerythrobacter jejuensis]
MSNWHIGILGGSGLYEGVALEDQQDIEVSSPFGAPSGPVTTGRIGDVKLTFMARHGAGHRLSPGSVNYRANIDVMKRCGVTDVLAISAIGSLREEMAPGSFVAVDQFIDRTMGRTSSFFGEGLVAHVALADPVCARLSTLAGNAAEAAGAKVHRGGTYIAMEGPQFSTRAESRMYREWGGDVIGMTGMPEAKLAREAELPYAMLAMVTDYDSWRDEEAGVETADILAVLQANADMARKTMLSLVNSLPATREASPHDTALEFALLTAPEKRDPTLLAKLDAVAGRVLG